MGEIWGMIHPGVEIVSLYQPVKPDNKLSIPNMQWWDRHRIDLPIPKGISQRAKGVTGTQQVQKVPG